MLQGGNLEAIESVHKTKEQKHGSPSTIDIGERIGDVLDDMQNDEVVVVVVAMHQGDIDALGNANVMLLLEVR